MKTYTIIDIQWNRIRRHKNVWVTWLRYCRHQHKHCVKYKSSDLFFFFIPIPNQLILLRETAPISITNGYQSRRRLRFPRFSKLGRNRIPCSIRRRSTQHQTEFSSGVYKGGQSTGTGCCWYTASPYD